MATTNHLKLKPEIIEQIRTDADMYALVAKNGNIRPESLPRTLRNNSSTLTQKSVLMALAKYLNVDENDLLMPEHEIKTTA